MNYKKCFFTIFLMNISFLSIPVYANPAHEKLFSLTESKRRLVFAAFLVKSGEKCSSVNKTFYQGNDKDGNAYWNASCLSLDSYQIQVINDAKGSTNILSCKLLKTLNINCFTKFKN